MPPSRPPATTSSARPSALPSATPSGPPRPPLPSPNRPLGIPGVNGGMPNFGMPMASQTTMYGWGAREAEGQGPAYLNAVQPTFAINARGGTPMPQYKAPTQPYAWNAGGRPIEYGTVTAPKPNALSGTGGYTGQIDTKSSRGQTATPGGSNSSLGIQAQQVHLLPSNQGGWGNPVGGGQDVGAGADPFGGLEDPTQAMKAQRPQTQDAAQEAMQDPLGGRVTGRPVIMRGDSQQAEGSPTLGAQGNNAAAQQSASGGTLGSALGGTPTGGNTSAPEAAGNSMAPASYEEQIASSASPLNEVGGAPFQFDSGNMQQPANSMQMGALGNSEQGNGSTGIPGNSEQGNGSTGTPPPAPSYTPMPIPPGMMEFVASPAGANPAVQSLWYDFRMSGFRGDTYGEQKALAALMMQMQAGSNSESAAPAVGSPPQAPFSAPVAGPVSSGDTEPGELASDLTPGSPDMPYAAAPTNPQAPFEAPSSTSNAAVDPITGVPNVDPTTGLPLGGNTESGNGATGIPPLDPMSDPNIPHPGFHWNGTRWMIDQTTTHNPVTPIAPGISPVTSPPTAQPVVPRAAPLDGMRRAQALHTYPQERVQAAQNAAFARTGPVDWMNPSATNDYYNMVMDILEAGGSAASQQLIPDSNWRISAEAEQNAAATAQAAPYAYRPTDPNTGRPLNRQQYEQMQQQNPGAYPTSADEIFGVGSGGDWHRPGEQAPDDSWRYDLGSGGDVGGWLAPGDPSDPNGTQVSMGSGFNPQMRGQDQGMNTSMSPLGNGF